MAAASTRPLTTPARARTAAAPKTSRRVNMVVLLSLLLAGAGICRGARSRCTRVLVGSSPDDRRVEVGRRKPEIALRSNGRNIGGNTPLGFRQQCEHVDLHGAV